MSFHRIGAMALVIICASGAAVMRAQACDSRIAGSCPGAPITNPSPAVEAANETAGAAAEPAAEQRTTRRSVRKRHSYRHRRHHHRRRQVAMPRPKPAATISAAEDTGAATRGIDAPRKGLNAVSRQAVTENFGIANSVPAESWAQVKLPSPLPPPAPMPQIASATNEPVAATSAEPPAAKAEAPAPARNKLVTTTSFKPIAGGAPPATEQVSNAPAGGGAPSMTTLRAMILAFAGLLAVGTAVRMVM
jgi:hypothetical protein